MHWYSKWFMMHNCFTFIRIIMKLHTQTPNVSKMCPIDFGVKVTMQLLLKMFLRIIAFPLYLQSCNFTHGLLMSPGYACMIGVKKTWRVLIGRRGGRGGGFKNSRFLRVPHSLTMLLRMKSSVAYT